MDARKETAALWNREIERWLSGERVVSEELRPWFECYKGRSDRGRPNLQAFPEAFLGDLFGTPKAAFLALNPGPVYPKFQYAPDGIFVRELMKQPYTTWAARWRYLDPSKPRVEGGLRFHSRRLDFLRRWLGDETLNGDSMLAFEVYPWHSQELDDDFDWNEAVRSLLRRYLWDPMAAAGVAYIFGVGADWLELFEDFDLPILGVLGEGGERVPFEKKRRILVSRPAPGTIALAMNNFNRPAPPNAGDTVVLREALAERGWVPE